MLTVPGLCWLCRMPLALSHWGFVPYARARSSARQPVSAMWITRRASFAPLRSLPAKPPPWQRLVSVSDYTPPLSLLVHQLKFTRRSEIAAALARLLLQEVLMARRSTGLQLPDRIVSVPLWSRRHWRRGFNQSDLLCQPLARWLGCAWDSQTITRVRATATQHHLSARLRKRNLKTRFALNCRYRVSIWLLWMMSSLPEVPSRKSRNCFCATAQRLSRYGACVEPCRASMMGVL